MGIITRAKKRRLEQEKLRVDLISSLPDGVLGDIVSLLPTEDGARTQVLSSRWRHLWRSAPLNLDLHNDSVDIHPSDISRVLSVHPGPGRRFVMPRRYSTEYPTTTTLDGWLRSHALDNLPELEFSLRNSTTSPLVVHRFSSTLCIARFFGCRFIIPAANYASPLQWPRLKELTLFHVSISERCLPTFLTGCPVLESLALLHSSGFPRLLIGSSSIRSIGVHPSYIHPGSIQRLIIEDAPCLEIYFGGISINISVISAPRLAIFGNLFHGFPTLQFVASVLKGSTVASMSAGVVSSVKVLALHDIKLSVDMVINLLRCLPQLQKLYIQTTRSLGKDWYTYQNHTSTVDIDVKKNVLRNYRGNKSHINLACFFISNAQVLESMRFEIEATNVSTKWIRRQQRLLQINKRASRRTQFDFVSNITRGCIDDRRAQQVHDLSADPFHRFH